MELIQALLRLQGALMAVSPSSPLCPALPAGHLTGMNQLSRALPRPCSGCGQSSHSLGDEGGELAKCIPVWALFCWKFRTKGIQFCQPN